MGDRESILDTAKAHVTRNRQATHGDVSANFNTVAEYWSAYLECDVKAVDVAAMMVLWKLARIKANPKHEDNWIDGAGYLALGGELAERTEPETADFDPTGGSGVGD